MTTLSQLKTSVDNWLARDDVAVSGTDFPQILLIAESDIARDVHCAIQETSTTLSFTGRSAALPSNYLSPRNPFIDDNFRKFEYMTPQAIRESSVWQNGRAGMFYTIEGDMDNEQLLMTIAGPASVSSPLSVNINYYARFAALTSDPDTNWLLANHYDVYLYATLRAAAAYIEDDVLETKYMAHFARVAEKQNRHEQRKKTGQMPKQAYGSPRTIV